MLQNIANSVGARSGTFTQWHELLGWHAPDPETKSNENLPLIKKQLYLSLCHRSVKILLGDLLKEMTIGYEKIEFPPQTNSSNLLKRALERTQSKSTQGKSANRQWRKIGSNEVTQIAITCSMYHTALQTLSQLKLEILSGLCYHETLLHDLFILLASLGPNCGLKSFLELLITSSNSYAPPLLMLLLFCDLMTHYITYVFYMIFSISFLFDDIEIF